MSCNVAAPKSTCSPASRGRRNMTSAERTTLTRMTTSRVLLSVQRRARKFLTVCMSDGRGGWACVLVSSGCGWVTVRSHPNASICVTWGSRVCEDWGTELFFLRPIYLRKSNTETRHGIRPARCVKFLNLEISPLFDVFFAHFCIPSMPEKHHLWL